MNGCRLLYTQNAYTENNNINNNNNNNNNNVSINNCYQYENLLMKHEGKRDDCDLGYEPKQQQNGVLQHHNTPKEVYKYVT